MSLVRIPRLWTKRYSYPSWRTLPENSSLDEEEALELFKHEERRWDAYETEMRNQYAVRQTTLVNQINQLDSYIFDTLTSKNNKTSDPFYIIEEGGGFSKFRELRDSAVREFLTEDGLYLVLEDGNVLGPYLGV